MNFAGIAPNERQSRHIGDRWDGDHHSTVSDTSTDDLEASFLKTSIKKSGLCTRSMEYASQCKKTLIKWGSTQPRNVWASICAVALGSLIILVLTALLIYFNIHLRRQIPHNDIQRIIAAWGAPGSPTQAEARYPTDFSRDIIPIPCHSHNDYWRKVPLYDALAAGCTGIEADIWLTDNDSLLVGHSLSSLASARSLKNLYIDPLISILNRQNPSLQSQDSSSSGLERSSAIDTTPINGVFETDPMTSLILLIDFKTIGTSTFPILMEHLQPLRSRGYLTHFTGSSLVPGPITIVASGNAPFDLIISNTSYRDVFFDAPLDQLWGDDNNSPSINAGLYNSDNSYYASVDFEKAIGRPWHGTLDPQQVDIILGQTRAAAARGLRARYWNTPAWPIAVREHIWDVLEREGVGMLNVDDLVGASRRTWRA